MTGGNRPIQAEGAASSSRLRVFLCHSSGDKARVRDLYKRLKSEGVDPWLDEEVLLPGQDWEQEIHKAVETTNVVLVCLSQSSITKAGFVQKEIKFALDVADKQPEGTIFIIPLRWEECTIPERLGRWHWVNYFETRGYDNLMRALRARAVELGIPLKPAPVSPPPAPPAPPVASPLPQPVPMVAQPQPFPTLISYAPTSPRHPGEDTTQPGPGTMRFLTGPLAGSTYRISKPTVSIGREPGNDIVITDPGVSRHHARITWNKAAWNITKLASQNMLTINQRDMQQSSLNGGDVIGLGPNTTFIFIIDDDTPTSPNLPIVNSQITAQQQLLPPPLVQIPETETVYFDKQGTPTLEISTNIGLERQIYELVSTKQVFNIGRDPSNDIVINRPAVSAFHAQIVREGNQLVFIHPHPIREKTLNGVDYKGRRVAGDEQFRHVLTRGDLFRILDEHGTFVTLTYNDGSGAAQEIVPEIRPIPLGAPVLTIGRLADNAVVLNHPQVSGHHARLEQVQGGYRIIDTYSTNHVYVNGERVTNRVLKVGDEVRIGPFKLTYTGTQLTQHDESNSIRIDALHLKKVGDRQTILLNDISITIPPRKFVAFVGGSGTGKSTLMDALNGSRPAQQGVVLYNGQNYYQNLAAFSTQLGYVPQDDIIHRDLSVERALYYAAKLRLPGDFTEKQIQQRIEEVLDDVEMKSRRKLLVSKLSGGQCKRVSIALELLANPSVFFLDEPLASLDPGLDRKMMFLLRKLADKGHTIILVTHITNNINACDYVCFLAQGGRLVYFGPPEEAKKYFGKTNFAEIYSALEPTEENPNIPAEAEARFKASLDYQKYVVVPLNQSPAAHFNPNAATRAIAPPKRGNRWKQFRILSNRSVELLKNDKGRLALLLLQAPVIGLILLFLAGHGTFDPTSIAECPLRQNLASSSGPIVSINCQRVVDLLNSLQGDTFAQQQNKSKDQVLQDAIIQGSGRDAQKILFIMAFAAVLFGCINGEGEISREIAIYQREHSVNLGIAPYIFSKVAVLGGLCMAQCFVLVFMVNLKAPLQQGIFLPPVLEIYITMALTSLACLMLGLAVSTLASKNSSTIAQMLIILIPQVIFSGVIFALNSPLLQFLGVFFAARWAMAGMGSSVGLHGDKIGADGFSFKGTLFTSLNPRTDVPGAVAHLLLVWTVLVVMIVMLSFAIAYFLKRKDIRS